MQAHTRAIVAASAHAIITGENVAGIYDHAEGAWFAFDVQIADEDSTATG
jgi:hypothetical protein